MSEPAPQGRFSLKTVVALILIGVFSLSALTVLSAYAPELRKGDDGGAHALSRSAVGFAGAVQLLRGAGEEVLLSRGPLHANADKGLLILTPGPQHSRQVVDAVRHEGPRLIVLPKWGTVPLAGRNGWVQVAGVYPAEAVANPVQLDDRKSTIINRRPGTTHPHLQLTNGEPFAIAGPVDQLQTISGPGWIPVVVDETGGAVLAVNEESGEYILADPDLINTHGLKSLETAQAAVRMMNLARGGDGPVIFDLTLPGFSRPRSLLRLAFEPPLLGATLALLAAAALVAYQASVRFGPGRHLARVIALGKRALADNTAGLVRLARREHRMGGPYAQLTRSNVARAIGAPRNLDGPALDAFLDRLGETMKTHDRYTALARDAEAARTPDDLIRVARNLHRWKLEMTRGRQ